MKRTEKEQAIMDEVDDFCKGHCAVSETCAEDDCVLWRIRQIILWGKKQ